jgi:ribosomal protein L37AE/L43A
MASKDLRTGKQSRPRTAVKGKRFRCATCHKRSPKPVKTPAPWYCPKCLAAAYAALAWQEDRSTSGQSNS